MKVNRVISGGARQHGGVQRGRHHYFAHGPKPTKTIRIPVTGLMFKRMRDLTLKGQRFRDEQQIWNYGFPLLFALTKATQAEKGEIFFVGGKDNERKVRLADYFPPKEGRVAKRLNIKLKHLFIDLTWGPAQNAQISTVQKQLGGITHDILVAGLLKLLIDFSNHVDSKKGRHVEIQYPNGDKKEVPVNPPSN